MSLDKQPKGLGDQIERFTEATGIKKLVKWAFGDDCGCDERKEYLNKFYALDSRSRLQMPNELIF